MFYNADSGLYLTQYRAYDPVTGRWLARDPFDESSDPSANLYRYANGNPIIYLPARRYSLGKRLVRSETRVKSQLVLFSAPVLEHFLEVPSGSLARQLWHWVTPEGLAA